MTFRTQALGALVVLCLAAGAQAQIVNTPPPLAPVTPAVREASTVDLCDKFTHYTPGDLLNGAARSSLWSSPYADDFRKCVDGQYGYLLSALKASEADVHLTLSGEFHTLQLLTRWYRDISKSYDATKKNGKDIKTTDDLKGAPDQLSALTAAYSRYRFKLLEELEKHNLLQPFSGVLKAGAAFLERGSSTSPTQSAAQADPTGSATTSNGSPLAHIDFESKHFGADRGTWVDASFTSTLGFEPALAFFKPTGVSINGATVNAAEATAYDTAFVFSVGGNANFAKFHAGEFSLTGKVGAVNLMNDVSVVDQGGQSYIAVPFGGDSTRLFKELGLQANLYGRGIDMAHLEKSSLTPLFHIEAGLRDDPRFESAGEKYFRPNRRTYLRVSAENVPVLGTVGGETKTFTLAFAWEYDGPWLWGTPAAGQTNIPSGNRFVIRGDINLLKALKPDTPAPPASDQPLVAPGGVHAEADRNQVTLTWNVISGAATYTIYRRIDPDTEFKAIASHLAVSPGAVVAVYPDRGVADPSKAFYKISANRGTSESDRSVEFSIAGVVTPAPATPPPATTPAAGTTTPATPAGSSPGGNAPAPSTPGTTTPAAPGSATPTSGIGASSHPAAVAAAGARQTLAIDVFDKDSGSRVVAHVVVDDNPASIEKDTDGNGHVEFNLAPGSRGFTITAHDYEPHREASFDNGLFGNPPGSVPRRIDVKLTHKAAPAAPRPTREAVLNMKANFFGGLDCHGARIFDPMIAVIEDRDCWYSAKKAEGLTHIVLSPAFQYPGFTSFDWWHNDPAQFKQLVLDVLNHGFVPVILLAQGEHFTERNSGHVTNAALTDHLDRDFRRMLPALADLAKFAVWVPGWEVIGPPEYWWTAFQFTHAIDLMGELLGNDAVIGGHAQPNRVTGASYCGGSADKNASMGGCVPISQNPDGTWNFVEPDDPSHGDEIGWFGLPAGKRLNLWLFQMDHDRHMADDGLKPCDSAYGRVCETLRRWVQEDRQSDALRANSARGPQWFRDTRPTFCAFETGALNVKNGDFGPEKLKLIAKRLSDIGVTCFGNGIP